MPKGLGILHSRLTKLVLLCQKSLQILSATNFEILLSRMYWQTTKYLITTVSITLKLNTFLLTGKFMFTRQL